MAEKKKRTFSGSESSQGHIVLRTPLRKAIFIGGLAGLALLAIILAVSG